MLWPRLSWGGHLPVCPVAEECPVCIAARSALAEQVRVATHDLIWQARRVSSTR